MYSYEIIHQGPVLADHLTQSVKMENTNPILIMGVGISCLALGRLLTNNGIANIIFKASQPEQRQGFSISLHDWGYSPLL